MKIVIEHADILHFEADVLALKYAQSLYGADRAVVIRLSKDGLNISDSLPAIHKSLLICSERHLAVKEVLFIGMPDLGSFSYQDIREFGRQVLSVLAKKASQARHICLTLHGIGCGLNEIEAFEAEIGGLLDAIKQREFPRQLKQITIVERDSDRAERLKLFLSKAIPNGDINLDNGNEGIGEQSVLQLLAAIKFAKQVLATISSNLNEQALQKFINQAVQHFASLAPNIAKSPDDIKFQPVIEICQDIRTKANMLASLSDGQMAKDSESIIQFVLTTLNPFQISIEVAWFRLQEYKKKEIGDFCYIVGITLILIHYAFIGHDLHVIKKNLDSKIKEVQHQILNEIGLKLIPENRFPWESVPQLLSGDPEQLIKLYQLSLELEK